MDATADSPSAASRCWMRPTTPLLRRCWRRWSCWQQPGRRFAVLGTMLELGNSSVALHRAVVERAVALNLDGLVAVAWGLRVLQWRPLLHCWAASSVWTLLNRRLTHSVAGCAPTTACCSRPAEVWLWSV